MNDPNEEIRKVVDGYRKPSGYQPPAEYTQRQIGGGISGNQNSSPENPKDPSGSPDPEGGKSWDDIPGVGGSGSGGGGSSSGGAPEQETSEDDHQSSSQDPDFKRIRKMVKPVVDGFDFINGLALVFFSGSKPEMMPNYRASAAYKKELVDYATETAIEEGWTNIRIHPAILLFAVILAAYGPLYYKAYNDRKANNKKRAEEEKRKSQHKKAPQKPPQPQGAPPSQSQAQTAQAPEEEAETTLVEDPLEPGSMITQEELRARTKRKPGRQKIPREKRSCVQCGDEFEAKVNSKKRFCGRRCSGLYQSQKNNSKVDE